MVVMQAYLDGEVDERTAKKVAKHLDSCADCQYESSVYVDIKKSLAQPKIDPDPDVLAALSDFTRNLAASGNS